MAYQVTHAGCSTRSLFGFIAGFLATLIFQQLTWWVLWCLGVVPFNAFSMAVNTFGVPEVLSHAFWAESGAFFLPCSTLDSLPVAVIG